MENNLICSNIDCQKCHRPYNLSTCKDKIDMFSWHCRNIKEHCDSKDFEHSIRQFSFFQHSHFTFQDIFQFIYSFLQKQTMLQCNKLSGIDYKHSAVDWCNFITEICKMYVYKLYETVQLEGEIEIDESLFGKKTKHHRGNPNAGLKIWVFGMIERSTNRLLLFPVCEQTKDVLVPLITKYIKKGSPIFSDGWASYCDLNGLTDYQYEHFTVIHKQAFYKKYKNVVTGEIIVVHTNTIEGAWAHAKKHFKNISSCLKSTFEAHLCEILWRNHHSKCNIYHEFLTQLVEIYLLEGPPSLNYPTNIFPSFNTSEEDNFQYEEDLQHLDSTHERSLHEEKNEVPSQVDVTEARNDVPSEVDVTGNCKLLSTSTPSPLDSFTFICHSDIYSIYTHASFFKTWSQQYQR